MKALFLIVLLSSFSARSQSELPLNKQWSIVKKISSEQRKILWRKGHDSVRSKETMGTSLSQIEDLISGTESSYKPLSSSEVEEILSCAQGDACAVFYIDLYSNYMSGYGHDRIWVRLNTITGTAKLFTESVYSE